MGRFFFLTLVYKTKRFLSMKNLFPIVLAFSFFVVSLSAEEGDKTEQSYRRSLSSQVEPEVIVSLKHFAKPTSDEGLRREVSELFLSTKNPRIAIQGALTLGKMGKSPVSGAALRDRVLKENNPDVVYSCLLAFLELQITDGKKDADALIALNHADQKFRSDEFIADLVDKVKVKFQLQ
jgi:hypothetical protein